MFSSTREAIKKHYDEKSKYGQLREATKNAVNAIRKYVEYMQTTSDASVPAWSNKAEALYSNMKAFLSVAQDFLAKVNTASTDKKELATKLNKYILLVHLVLTEAYGRNRNSDKVKSMDFFGQTFADQRSEQAEMKVLMKELNDIHAVLQICLENQAKAFVPEEKTASKQSETTNAATPTVQSLANTPLMSKFLSTYGTFDECVTERPSLKVDKSAYTFRK